MKKPTLIHLFNEVELINPLLMCVQGMFWIVQLMTQFPIQYLIFYLKPVK